MKIALSPMDYYFYRTSLYTIQFVFEYNGQLDLKRFVENLDQAVQIFPAVSSRIKIISETEIILETGGPIVPRVQKIELDEEIFSDNEIEQLLDSVSNIENGPLLKIVVSLTSTRTFIGFSFSHMLGDGASFFQFLIGFSKICTGQQNIFPPSNQRELLHIDSIIGGQRRSLFEATGYIRPRPPNPTQFNLEILSYSKHELNQLKIKCSAPELNLSTNDIIMADLAKRFHQDIPLQNNQFIIRCPVDYRKIYDLPADYFGNAVRDAIVQFTPEEIEQLPMSEVAIKIHKGIKMIDKNSVYESLQSLEILRRDHGIKVFEDVGCPGFLVSNLSKFPIQKINLGLGPPIGHHQASLNPRLAVILPLADGVEVRFKRPIESIK